MPTSDDATVVRFWGTTLSAGVPLKLSLSSTELHVTQAVLVGGKRATIYASTNGVPSIALTVLSSAAPTALIDVCFFDDDETVELRVDGEGANVALSGSICVHVPPSDEEGESDEDAPKATFVEQTGDADEEEVRPRRSRAKARAHVVSYISISHHHLLFSRAGGRIGRDRNRRNVRRRR